MRILYEDKSIVVCEKVSGELSEGEGKNCLPAMLRAYFSEKREKNTEVFTVHRLDRETKGVMVFARDSRSAAAISESVRDGSFKKEYLAVCMGMPEHSEATLTDLIYYDRRAGKSYIADKKRNGVKEAVLDYTVIGTAENCSLLRVRLHTGRTHQIRVQLASRKHSLLGDRRYGAPKSEGDGIALVACRLSFPHPKSGELLTFVCETPKTFPWSLFPEELGL